jgi:hypothetical protein
MNPKTPGIVIVAILSVVLSGCCTTEKPSSITLMEALRQVQSGIVQLQQSKEKTGMVVSSAQVTFNITESRDKNGSLSLNLAPAVTQVAGGTLQFANDHKQSASNQITITFQNIFTASKDTVAGIAVTPTAITKEVTTTTAKDGTQTVVEKTTSGAPQMTLDELYKYLGNTGTMTLQ